MIKFYLLWIKVKLLPSALVLLDLSAVFDTADHSLLLQRLEHWFGITRFSLDWYKSYRFSRLIWEIGGKKTETTQKRMAGCGRRGMYQDGIGFDRRLP